MLRRTEVRFLFYFFVLMVANEHNPAQGNITKVTPSNTESSVVQYWVSILIAVYGAALLAFSRKCDILLQPFATSKKKSLLKNFSPAICGWIADQTSSRRSPLLLGLLALLGATIMLNVGSSCSVLVVARVLQGISAAAVYEYP